MKMEIENNSQNSLVKTGNRAIFAAPKGESARIATAKTAFCTYFARLPFRKTRNLWFSSANETATPPTNQKAQQTTITPQKQRDTMKKSCEHLTLYKRLIIREIIFASFDLKGSPYNATPHRPAQNV